MQSKETQHTEVWVYSQWNRHQRQRELLTRRTAFNQFKQMASLSDITPVLCKSYICLPTDLGVDDINPIVPRSTIYN